MTMEEAIAYIAPLSEAEKEQLFLFLELLSHKRLGSARNSKPAAQMPEEATV